MPLLPNPHLALKFSQGLSGRFSIMWRLVFIMRIVNDGLCTCPSLNNRKWKTKNFSGKRLPRGQPSLLVFGSQVTRLSGTSRAYILLGNIILALNMVLICANFLLKALIVKIVVHIGHDVLWFSDRGWKASMNKFYKKGFYFDELF